MFGGRPWKNYVRRLSDIIRITMPDLILQRNNVTNFNHLQPTAISKVIVKNTFKMFYEYQIPVQYLTVIFFSPLSLFSFRRYKGLFQYAWYSVAHVNERFEEFPNPSKFVFDEIGEECKECDEMPVMKCSWCRVSLCTNHFFVSHHLCDKFVS